MLEEIAVKLELRTTDIQKVVKILVDRSRIANTDLVRLSGLPKTHLQRLLVELKDYLEPSGPFCQFKPEAKKTLSTLISPVDWPAKKSQIISILSRYQKSLPVPDRQLDQFYATINTSARRAVLMAKNGDLDSRSVAILGDDDLNSVAIALIAAPSKITVFEKDNRITSLVSRISQENNLGIDLVEMDLTQKIPEKFHQQFDTVFSDPPYTPAGIGTFLNRGIELMKPRLLSRFYLCYGNSDRARERELAVQGIIVAKGLLMRDKKYHFNHYLGAESIGDRSSLYLLDWTPKTKTTSVSSQKIYSYE